MVLVVLGASFEVADLWPYAVLGFMAVRLVGGVRGSRTAAGRSLVSAVRRRISWRHVAHVPLVLAAVLAVAVPLMMVPGLDWGWWSAIGGEGNPVFGTTESTAGTVWEWLVPLLFMALLLPALPLFAYAEERIFRAGAEAWSTRRRVLKVLQFGLVHALIGVPIGAAIALSVGGAHFMRVYLREHARSGSRAEATLASTAAHTVYNGVIVLAFTVFLVAELAGA